MLIIVFSSQVNKNNAILGFCQHRVNKGNFSCTSPSFLFPSVDSLPSGIVDGGEMGGCIKAACPAVDQGRNPAGGWLPVSGVTWPEARDPHRRGETIIISGWSLVQYLDFFLALYE